MDPLLVQFQPPCSHLRRLHKLCHILCTGRPLQNVRLSHFAKHLAPVHNNYIFNNFILAFTPTSSNSSVQIFNIFSICRGAIAVEEEEGMNLQRQTTSQTTTRTKNTEESLEMLERKGIDDQVQRCFKLYIYMC